MTDFELAKQHFLEGCACLDVENYAQAESHFQQSLELVPDRPSTLTNLSVSQLKLQKYSEAKASAEKAISLEDGNSEAYLNLGLIEKELKQLNAALIYFDRAISLNSSYVEAYSNKGNILQSLERYEEAIAHYDKAIALKPDYAEAYSNKGNVLNELKRYEEAIAQYDKALGLKPEYAEGWSNKGITLQALKRYEDAIAHYDKALSLKPGIDWVRGDLLHAKMRIAHWSGLQDGVKTMADQVLQGLKVTSPFTTLALLDDPLLHKKASQIYAKEKYPPNAALGPIEKRSMGEKIRIAYFSADFCNHPVAYLTAELFEMHDRSQFEVMAFSLVKTSPADDMSARLKNGFDRFIEVEDLSDQAVAKLAREFGVDIAIDLTGPTLNSRTGIFAYRAAPIQVNWLGYPGTIGAEFIDYIVADSTIIPKSHRQFYVEKVVCLPNTYMVDDSKRLPSSRIFSKKECGLPEHAFVFCCFNNDYKLNSLVLDSWAKILHGVKQSVLWISENNASFRVNLVAEFEKRGVEANRIIFAKRVELMTDHLARYRLADLFLDTYPYNAHTTAIDSLKAGVPVLTLPGKSFASRVAASLLNTVGLSELIANTPDEYEALAIDLASNPDKLNAFKASLSSQRESPPLFDTKLFAQDLEAAFTMMYERYQAGLLPEAITIA